MDMMVYNCRPDERPLFDRWGAALGVDWKGTEEALRLETAALAAGCPCVNVTSDTPVSGDVVDRLAELGVKLIACRTVGYEHVDAARARERGMGVTHISYSPASVADYALMLMLMVTRNVKTLMLRSLGQDYALTDVRGRELPGLTVGIAGTGRIGSLLARRLQSFGCRVLAWSPHPREELKELVTYTDRETLLRESDILSLHLRAAPETYHFIDAAALAAMKPGAVLINTARGSLVDSAALIDAVESGHLGGAGLDVVEGDRPVYYRDHKNQVVAHREMAVLNSFPNVLMLPHMAFFTDEAVEDMVRNSLEGAKEYLEQGSSPWEVEL